MNLSGSLPIAILLSVLSYPGDSSSMKVKFTNVQCEDRDPEFCTFKRCELKALSRDKVSMYAHLKIHKLPIKSATINAAFFVKASGYRPYLYNSTLDVCKFLKKPTGGEMFWKIFLDMFKYNSNLNHTCPYNHDLIVDGMILDPNMFKLIPFPSNYYMIRLTVTIGSRIRAESRTYFQIYD